MNWNAIIPMQRNAMFNAELHRSEPPITVQGYLFIKVSESVGTALTNF